MNCTRELQLDILEMFYMGDSFVAMQVVHFFERLHVVHLNKESVDIYWKEKTRALSLGISLFSPFVFSKRRRAASLLRSVWHNDSSCKSNYNSNIHRRCFSLSSRNKLEGRISHVLWLLLYYSTEPKRPTKHGLNRFWDWFTPLHGLCRHQKTRDTV
jgi:ribosomal protein S10